jgi:hypothetical protein
LANNVVQNASRLANARTGFHHEVFLFAIEPKLDPSPKDVNKVASHVVPVPPSLLFEGLNGTYMLGPNPPPSGRCEPKVAVLDKGARPFSMEGTFTEPCQQKFGFTVRQRQRGQDTVPPSPFRVLLSWTAQWATPISACAIHCD